MIQLSTAVILPAC